MSLAPGSRLGLYDVTALIGRGGMGEVYRAKDTKLQRDVALKVLPTAVAGDAERLARFRREAQVLAALNNPHIAQIYGLEESSDGIALVMEWVDGEDLAERIGRGPVPVDETLAIARQIAEALDGAHTAGIVHRDLKPSNIRVRLDGTVKVLDFGIAKAMDRESGFPGSGDPANSPTIATPAMTEAGVIMGTAAYMSPEQARGKVVDKRTDIWAFGCVIYEMLTGRRTFDGDTITDVLAAIVHNEPDWSHLPFGTPAAMRRVLRRCLQKDARLRLRDVGDVGPDLSLPDNAPQTDLTSTTRRLFWMALPGSALAIILVAAVRLWPSAAPQERRPLRVSILHAEGTEMGAAAISPDGRRVAYGARRADGLLVLWVRNLASGETRLLAGTEDATYPFWSPDSRELGFFSGVALKRVPADGGPVQVVAQGVDGRGGSWAGDGTIIFRQGPAPLFKVSAAGGTSTPATKVQQGDWSHLWPSFLPDGRRFLFTAKQWTVTAETSEQGIFLGSLDGPGIHRLLPDLSSAVYAPPGYLVFARDGALTAAPFDLATGRVSGPPVPIGDAVAVDGLSSFSAVSVAADGTLAVRPPPANGLARSPVTELHAFDRFGNHKRVGTAEAFVDTMALHPGSSRAAAQIVDLRTGTSDIWLIDLREDTKTPLTRSSGYAGAPVWSPDGTRIAYAYQPPGQLDDIHIHDVRTGRTAALLETPTSWEHPVAWSGDGASLLIERRDENGKRGIWKWSFESGTLAPFLDGGVAEAAFSPDGRYVAFSSEASGRAEVSVVTFPEPRQTWPVTTDGGRIVSWRADGREVLVATPSGHIVAYPVSTGNGFSAGQPAVLVRNIGSTAPYAAAARDHSRIVVRVSPDATQDRGEIRLLFNWADTLRPATVARP